MEETNNKGIVVAKLLKNHAETKLEEALKKLQEQGKLKKKKKKSNGNDNRYNGKADKP